MMYLIGLTGLPKAGKDTAANVLGFHHYVNLKFAGPLKDAASILLGRSLADCNGDNGFDREAVMPEWGFSMRHFLQVFGTECMRDNFGQDFWVRKMRNTIAALPWQPYGVRAVITDVRFDNEAALVRELGGVIVEIRRPGLVRSAHVSDAGVEADLVVDNDGTPAQFAQKIGQLMLNLHESVADHHGLKSST